MRYRYSKLHETRRMGSFMRDEENPAHARRRAAESKAPRGKRCVMRRRGEVETECEPGVETRDERTARRPNQRHIRAMRVGREARG
jgi:hypothetical protein